MEKNRGLEWVREKGLEIMEITIIILIMFPKFKAYASLLGLGLFLVFVSGCALPRGHWSSREVQGAPLPRRGQLLK